MKVKKLDYPNYKIYTVNTHVTQKKNICISQWKRKYYLKKKLDRTNRIEGNIYMDPPN